MGWGLTTDSFNTFGGDYTIFHYVKNLSETLASEDDKQLAENYKGILPSLFKFALTHLLNADESGDACER